MVVTEVVFESFENLSFAPSLFMTFAKKSKSIITVVLRTCILIPSGSVALCGYKGFYIYFISFVLAFQKAGRSTLWFVPSVLVLFK